MTTLKLSHTCHDHTYLYEGNCEDAADEVNAYRIKEKTFRPRKDVGNDHVWSFCFNGWRTWDLQRRSFGFACPGAGGIGVSLRGCVCACSLVILCGDRLCRPGLQAPGDESSPWWLPDCSLRATSLLCFLR